MTALSANYEDQMKDGKVQEYPVLGLAHIYKGGMCVDKGTGYASAGSDAGAYTFLGVAAEESDNSGSSTDGAKVVRINKTGSYVFNKASAAQTDIGVAMYLEDDCTVAASTTNSILAGYVVDVPSSSTVRIRIDSAVK